MDGIPFLVMDVGSRKPLRVARLLPNRVPLPPRPQTLAAEGMALSGDIGPEKCYLEVGDPTFTESELQQIFDLASRGINFYFNPRLVDLARVLPETFMPKVEPGMRFFYGGIWREENENDYAVVLPSGEFGIVLHNTDEDDFEKATRVAGVISPQDLRIAFIESESREANPSEEDFLREWLWVSMNSP